MGEASAGAVIPAGVRRVPAHVFESERARLHGALVRSTLAVDLWPISDGVVGVWLHDRAVAACFDPDLAAVVADVSRTARLVSGTALLIPSGSGVRLVLAVPTLAELAPWLIAQTETGGAFVPLAASHHTLGDGDYSRTLAREVLGDRAASWHPAVLTCGSPQRASHRREQTVEVLVGGRPLAGLTEARRGRYPELFARARHEGRVSLTVQRQGGSYRVAVSL